MSWETANISDGTYTVTITGTNAPALGDTATGIAANTKTFSITLAEDKALTAGQTYTIKVTHSSSTSVTASYSLEVPADEGGDTSEPKTITGITASFVDAKTVKVSWTAPAGVTNARYMIEVQNESKTIKGAADNATSPATVTLNQAAPSGTQVAATVYALKAATSEVLAEGSVKVTYTPTSNPAEDTTPPTTNSQGIPVASEVKNEKQANAAVETLKKADTTELAERLENSTAAAESFETLERAVKAVKNIRVEEEEKSGAPKELASGVEVVGAAFNADSSVVKVVRGPASKSYSPTSGYQFSLTLTGESNAAKLAVPVIVKLPVPAGMNASRLVVLHYHGGSSYPTVINPSVSGKTLSFVVSGFSDFVVTYSSEIPSDAYTGGAYTTVQGGKNKNDGSLDDATLASIAAMLSGDGVFVDVPGSHWAAKEIRWARDGGLMSGYENGAFGPTASTTRQQLWMVLARLSGTRPGSMAEARQWAINTGVSDGSNPTGALSRQQLVTMLYRFAKTQGKDVSASAKLTGFADSGKVASYAKEALSWASAKGIMSGSNGKLNPEGTATRAHFAVFLYRYSNG